MTGALSFILPLRDASPSLWRLCLSLAAVTAPGDRIVAVDGGSRDKTPQLLRRFATEIGWGPEVGFELIALEEPGMSLAALAEIGRDRAMGSWCLEIHADDLVLASGIAALREVLSGQENGIVLANHAWMLAGPASPLPCPDADRWPDQGSDISARATAQRLYPDPQRVICRSGGPVARVLASDLGPSERYDAALEDVPNDEAEIGFCTAPVRLAPLPPDTDLVSLTAMQGILQQLPANAASEIFEPHLLRAGDALIRLSPGQAEPWLEQAQTGLAALPRRLRKAICAHDSPAGRLLGILQKEGRSAARTSLSLILAETQRQQADALRDEVAQLRADLDIALPGADYLERMRARARRI